MTLCKMHCWMQYPRRCGCYATYLQCRVEQSRAEQSTKSRTAGYLREILQLNNAREKRGSVAALRAQLEATT